MAREMIQTVLDAETRGREMEAETAEKAAKLISDAEIQAGIIIKASTDQATSQAQLIISEAQYTCEGILRQAEKLAELREKKSIADTEKQYEAAMSMIFEEILS